MTRLSRHFLAFPSARPWSRCLHIPSLSPNARPINHPALTRISFRCCLIRCMSALPLQGTPLDRPIRTRTSSVSCRCLLPSRDKTAVCTTFVCSTPPPPKTHTSFLNSSLSLILDLQMLASLASLPNLANPAGQTSSTSRVLAAWLWRPALHQINGFDSLIPQSSAKCLQRRPHPPPLQPVYSRRLQCLFPARPQILSHFVVSFSRPPLLPPIVTVCAFIVDRRRLCLFRPPPAARLVIPLVFCVHFLPGIPQIRPFIFSPRFLPLTRTKSLLFLAKNPRLISSIWPIAVIVLPAIIFFPRFLLWG